MTQNTKETYQYKAEMRQLLSIIVHSLYTHPEVFLRELISNASDALNKVRFRKLTDTNILDYDTLLEITITADKKKNILTIEDTGIGMVKDELVNNIGTIARSGTLEFLKKAREEGKVFDEKLIGQFGVGFYSVFMVADEVTIETRHADKDSTALRWVSKGEGSFEIEECDRKNRGTKIICKLKESALDFAQENKVKDTINKYSNFADFPIYVGENKVNTVSALWQRKSPDIKESEHEEFYKYISNDYEAPLGHIHMNIEGAVNFKALLYIPKVAPPNFLWIKEVKSVHLYSNRVLIQDDCKEILPEYLRFLKGVVDTVDLPLNVSREVTQNSPVTAKIRGMITNEALSYLSKWSSNEPDKFRQFYDNFGVLLKAGINTDVKNRDKLIDLMRFETSVKPQGEYVSFKEYVSNMKKDQKEIYYVSGEKRSVIEKNPNLEYFKKKGIEVLFLTDPADVFTVPSIGEYDKKKIASIDKADLELMPEDRIEKPDNNLSKSLIKVFKEALGGKVEDVVISKRLVDSPVTLVTGKRGMDTQMEKMIRMMDKNYAHSKKIMEVNMSHALIKNLAGKYMVNSKDPFLKTCIEQLYEGALFMDGNLASTTDFIQRMNEIMVEATKPGG